MHLTSYNLTKYADASASSITTDIDNETRSTTIPWMGADEKPINLPIELNAFAAHCIGNSVLLSWSTSSETNNDYFTLERSADASLWEVIGTVQGAGNSNNMHNYAFTDTEPLQGTTYYRLSQTDYDGQSETFPVDAVGCEEVTVNPNPFGQELIVDLKNLNSGETTVTIWDVTGRSVMHITLEPTSGETSVTLDVSSLSQGMYLVEIRSGAFGQVWKMTKEY